MYYCVTVYFVTTGRQAWLKKITQSTSQYTINKVSFRPNSAEIIFFFEKKKIKATTYSDFHPKCQQPILCK